MKYKLAAEITRRVENGPLYGRAFTLAEAVAEVARLIAETPAINPTPYEWKAAQSIASKRLASWKAARERIAGTRA